MDSAPEITVDPRLVERFWAGLESLWLDHDEGGKLGIAVSGGPDSVALLLLAHAALPGRVVAATVDHGLRPESAGEAKFVADLCARLSIPHETLVVTVEPGNLQDRARAARYDALLRHFLRNGADAMATAHHADDQAETVMMRLNRGSGVGGLAGIRARVFRVLDDPLAECFIFRPLLDWRRAELAAIVSAAGIEPVQDPSNLDDRFDRARMRAALAQADWLDPIAIATSARILQDAERIVEERISEVESECVFEDDGSVWFHWGHTRLEEIEVVKRILHRFGSAPRGSSVARMVDQLHTEGVASLGGILARRDWHRSKPNVQTDAWKFEKEPPRRTG